MIGLWLYFKVVSISIRNKFQGRYNKTSTKSLILFLKIIYSCFNYSFFIIFSCTALFVFLLIYLVFDPHLIIFSFSNQFGSLLTLIVHCHQQYCSPFGPFFYVSLHLYAHREGSDTYTRFGSMLITRA